MSKICMIVGARPNFMKMAPVILESCKRGLPTFTVHTNQHYDRQMSQIFFEDLQMPRPDIQLGIGSGSHAGQTARVMMAFESVCMEQRPDLVVVAGDVNSTLACALVASKLEIPVAHVEAGLRSFDRAMPEETNRVLTDHMSSLLFVTEPSGRDNLLREGIAAERIHFVGNSMIDSVRQHLQPALARRPWDAYGFGPGEYGLVTLHRPSNVDDLEKLADLALALESVAAELPLLFPVHPRTRQRAEDAGIRWGGVRLVEPLGYLEFLGLMASARLVLTDSGGIQEETTALGVPCLTLRENTERPVTITHGTNQLVGVRGSDVIAAARNAIVKPSKVSAGPPLWDGAAAVRIVDEVERWLAHVNRSGAGRPVPLPTQNATPAGTQAVSL